MSFDTERFIAEIKNRPSIWNTGYIDYNVRDLKVKHWEEIVDIFKEKDNMKVHEKKQLGYALQKKWKSIRGCFTRELNRQNSVKMGSSFGPRKSEYVYFKQLQFLRNVVSIREPDPLAIAEALIEDSFDESPKSTKSPKSTSIEYSEDDKLIEDVNKSIENGDVYDANSEHEDRFFLLSLLSTLKRVPQHKKMTIKIQIMSLLDEATQGVFN